MFLSGNGVAVNEIIRVPLDLKNHLNQQLRSNLRTFLDPVRSL